MSSFKVDLLQGKYILYMAVIWPFIFIPVCYILYYVYDSSYYTTIFGVRQIATISVAGTVYPSYVIFTFGLHIESVLLMCMFTCIYTSFHVKIDNLLSRPPQVEYEMSGHHEHMNQKMLAEELNSSSLSRRYWSNQCLAPARPNLLHFWNRIAYRFGMIAAVLMFLVGSIIFSVNIYAHVLLAFFMFFFGILHMLIFHIKLNHFCRHETNNKDIVIHQIALFICIPLNIILLLCAGIAYLIVQDEQTTQFAAQITPALEYSTTIAFILYLIRYRNDVHDVKLSGTVPNETYGVDI